MPDAIARRPTVTGSEASRPRTARVEIKHSIANLVLGNVTVAAYHNRKSCGPWIEVQLRQIVQHINTNVAEFEHRRFRQLSSPSALVDIATYCDKWSHCRKLRKNFRAADVAGMNDMFRSQQGFEGLRAQQAMRVGDDAD